LLRQRCSLRKIIRVHISTCTDAYPEKISKSSGRLAGVQVELSIIQGAELSG
jgi:hypothetical protein